LHRSVKEKQKKETIQYQEETKRPVGKKEDDEDEETAEYEKMPRHKEEVRMCCDLSDCQLCIAVSFGVPPKYAVVHPLVPILMYHIFNGVGSKGAKDKPRSTCEDI
jgi:hypothetical protein